MPTSTGPSPSFADIAAAMKVLQQPEPREPLGKHVTTIIIAATIGLGAWVMNGLNTMQTTVTQVATTVSAMQRTIDDMSRRTDTGAATTQSISTTVARLDQRVSQVEQKLNGSDRRGSSHASPQGTFPEGGS